MNQLTYTLRDATADDANFVNALTRNVMAVYVNQTWALEEEREAYFQKNIFNLETTKIIQIDGQDIGRWSIEWSSDFVLIDNVHLLPEYQGRGIGRRLIEEIVMLAETKGLFAKLMVLRVNPARHLYEFLGFKVHREDGERLYMSTQPELPE